jgi:plastocyanin
MLPRVLGMSRNALLVAACAAALAASGGGAQSRAASTPPAPLHRLEGRIELVEKGRPAGDRTLDRRHAAVWFEPSVAPKPGAPTAAVMTTERKQFSPQVVVVPVGSSVRFPNQDPILHNVFSVSGRNTFDLGLVGKGPGRSATFKEAGIVRVFCNVHHAMFAHVVVVATPHFAVPDAEGRFRLEGLPAGSGRLKFWHERGEVGERLVTLPAAGALALQVEITQPRVPPHKNKVGRAYTRGAYE